MSVTPLLPSHIAFSPNTQTISKPLQTLVFGSGGSIRVFDPATGSFSQWNKN
ncbi:UNVERIFIED_ORG: hypothetical protein ABIC62_006614 [Burkholderia sp. 1595]|uniref:Uncharacterized protein n=1 Tax=Paraburkholderia terricola TaxID=169427 RepID=A0ABU1M2C6_9BURK|nr:hypothetical protein [Paraburkholderia terricola]